MFMGTMRSWQSPETPQMCPEPPSATGPLPCSTPGHTHRGQGGSRHWHPGKTCWCGTGLADSRETGCTGRAAAQPPLASGLGGEGGVSPAFSCRPWAALASSRAGGDLTCVGWFLPPACLCPSQALLPRGHHWLHGSVPCPGDSGVLPWNQCIVSCPFHLPYPCAWSLGEYQEPGRASPAWGWSCGWAEPCRG